MPFVLRLYEDVLASGEVAELAEALPRAIYVTAGAFQVTAASGSGVVEQDNGHVSLGPTRIEGGAGGACLWRFEIAPAGSGAALPVSSSHIKLEAPIFDHDVSTTHLLRLDSVAFPPGGCALLHTHQGPGIRCLIEGTIRIDCEGHSSAHGPGSPWFEAGPEPVFALAAEHMPSRFIRAMVLPKELAGQSSIRYVNEEDKAKPKSQTYRVFGEKLLSG